MADDYEQLGGDNTIFTSLRQVLDFLREVPDYQKVHHGAYMKAVDWIAENTEDVHDLSFTKWV